MTELGEVLLANALSGHQQQLLLVLKDTEQKKKNMKKGGLWGQE